MTTINDVYQLTSKADVGGITQAEKAIEGLDQAQEDLGNNTKKSAFNFTNLNSAVELGAKAFGVVKDVIEQTVGKQIEYADNIDNMSRALGVSAEEASKLAYATKAIGISQEELKTALNGAIQKGLDPSIAGLAKLAEKYNAIEDPLQRSKFLLENFGDAGLKLGALLERGAEGVRALGDEAKNYGVIMDEAAIAKTKEFEESVRKLEASADRLKVDVGGKIVDVANTTIDYYETWGREAQGVTARETELREAIIRSAFIYGEASGQVRFYSDELKNLLIAQQAIAMTSTEKSLRENMAALNQTAAAVQGVTNAYIGYDQGAPDTQTALRETETATRDLSLATQDLTAQFIYNQASQNMAPEAALELGRALGFVKDETIEAMHALDAARASADSNRDGYLSASEAASGYVSDVQAINAAIAALQDKHIEVTVDTIINEVALAKAVAAATAEQAGLHGGGPTTTPSSVSGAMSNKGLK